MATYDKFYMLRPPLSHLAIQLQAQYQLLFVMGNSVEYVTQVVPEILLGMLRGNV